jgi:hypothetical protein
MIMDFIPEGTFSVDHGLLLAAASVVTASIASFLLGLVMVIVILLSRKFKINPDNVATPIAGKNMHNVQPLINLYGTFLVSLPLLLGPDDATRAKVAH